MKQLFTKTVAFRCANMVEKQLFSITAYNKTSRIVTLQSNRRRAKAGLAHGYGLITVSDSIFPNDEELGADNLSFILDSFIISEISNFLGDSESFNDEND